MNKLIDYINKNLSLEDEYFRIFGEHLTNSKFKCPNPMHQHKNNTPSCKMYGNVFKCFGQCNRVFGVYDLLKWYNAERINEIKSSIIIEDSQRNVTSEPIVKVNVDRSKPMAQILYDITGINIGIL